MTLMTPLNLIGVLAFIALVIALLALYKARKAQQATNVVKNLVLTSDTNAGHLSAPIRREVNQLQANLQVQAKEIDQLKTAIGRMTNQLSASPQALPTSVANVHSGALQDAALTGRAKLTFVSETFYLKVDQQGEWPASLVSSVAGENFYFQADTTSPTTADLKLIRGTGSLNAILDRPQDYVTQALKLKNTGGSTLVEEQPGKISRSSNGIWILEQPVFVVVG